MSLLDQMALHLGQGNRRECATYPPISFGEYGFALSQSAEPFQLVSYFSLSKFVNHCCIGMVIGRRRIWGFLLHLVGNITSLFLLHIRNVRKTMTRELTTMWLDIGMNGAKIIIC